MENNDKKTRHANEKKYVALYWHEFMHLKWQKKKQIPVVVFCSHCFQKLVWDIFLMCKFPSQFRVCVCVLWIWERRVLLNEFNIIIIIFFLLVHMWNTPLASVHRVISPISNLLYKNERITATKSLEFFSSFSYDSVVVAENVCSVYVINHIVITQHT